MLAVARRADEDVEVAAHQRVGGGRSQLLQLRNCSLQVRLLPLENARLQVEHFGIVTFDAERRGALGVVARHDVEQDLRVAIALIDPARLRCKCSRRDECDDQYASSKHETSPEVVRQIGKLMRC
jgi:hypothetical protein